MATILITGGTGLIGKALTKALLDKDHEVIVLTRSKTGENSLPRVTYAQWDIQKQFIEKEAISRADYVIHLAGAGVVEKRWTEKRKKIIVDSRVKSAALLVTAMKKIPNKVKAVIGASAIGWYGEDSTNPAEAYKETDPATADFLGQTCKQWEESLETVMDLGKRLVIFRIGIVLSNNGGTVKEFEKYLRFGIATVLGSGKQIMSWIHIDDLVRMFVSAIEIEGFHGIYNAVSPNPVSNKELVLELARAKRGKFFIQVPVPSFVLKLILGKMSIEVLKSATVSSEKIQSTGFLFQYPDLPAMRDYF
jgi:uncharacterized protein